MNEHWFVKLGAGTIPQWGMLVTLLTIAAGLITAWIKGAPDRKRAENEKYALDNHEAIALRGEMVALNQLARKDIHDLRNRLQELTGVQAKCEKALAAAHSENQTYREDMQTLRFLIRLLISEIKRIDPEPGNAIIGQAEMVLADLEQRSRPQSPDGSMARAKDTVKAAEATVDELKSGSH